MHVADGVERFVDQDLVNWYLVEIDDGVVAVDAGFPTAWRDVEPRLGELRAIVITHAHIDHLGFAERARREAGVPVYVPQGDAELARHTIRAAKAEGNRVQYLLRHGPARRTYWKALRSGGVRAELLRDFKTYGPGAELPGGLRAVPTPGHTFGHMALHLHDRDVLFAGDAVVMEDPYTGLPGPRLVARAATADSDQALRSLAALARTGASTVLTGHGDPWTEGASAAADEARANGVV